MHCTAQVPLIELIGAFVPIEGAFNIEMAKVDVAVQKDLPDAFALISRNTKALLCESLRGGFAVPIPMMDGWFNCSHSTKARASACSDAHYLVLQQVGI
jgi:hypothetical protein